MVGRVLVVATFILVAGCATPADTSGGGGDPTASPSEGPVAGIERPPDDQFANTVADADAPVEQAFAGRVVAVDDGGPAPWVTFAVDRWFTDDLGQSIGLWAPGFDGEVESDWLIAATRYHAGDGPAGDVLVDASAPRDDDTFAAWEEDWGGSIAPGGDLAEASADPEVLAELDDARARWEATEPPQWTATIAWSERDTVYGQCGAGPVRVVVVDGAVTEAVDLDADCDVDDPPTITAVFDRAEEVAGAFEEPPAFHDEYGFPTWLSAWDRSVQVELGVSDFVPVARPLGDAPPDEALAEARARWDAAGIDDYTMVVDPQCFCGFYGEVEVEVVDGEVVEVRPSEPEVSADDYQGIDLTVEGIFADIDDTIATGMAAVAYDPDLGYPTSADLDPMPDAVDDEITYLVTSLEPTSTE
ncbi:DUF6174 domain-containing protein [Salsipaludibacter albus]|uniref:DUF6174 domain-containing protein n=1 Tax=Salsipaludibacter albus TaxID=2849650 RepID=UPI001EE3F948|nr:DUF6174 domain-containing protein [Salsipaludibacter albus]MBY5164115.1 hypothetical protein [Salsipaludibacter albus]